MSEATDFAAGKSCVLHEIPFCADCRERLGIRRGAGENKNQFYFTNDCAVASFQELTGAGYDEAVEALGDGFAPRAGTKTTAIIEALEAAGYRTERAGLGTVSARGARADGLTIPEARAASTDGKRQFLIVGHDRYDAHAWTITDGRVNRAFLKAPYKYGIIEVKI